MDSYSHLLFFFSGCLAVPDVKEDMVKRNEQGMMRHLLVATKRQRQRRQQQNKMTTINTNQIDDAGANKETRA